MKIRALGPLSGASGDREKGEVFIVAKDYGEGLISRGYAVEVVETAASPAKPGKSEQDKE